MSVIIYTHERNELQRMGAQTPVVQRQTTDTAACA